MLIGGGNRARIYIYIYMKNINNCDFLKKKYNVTGLNTTSYGAAFNFKKGMLYPPISSSNAFGKHDDQILKIFAFTLLNSIYSTPNPTLFIFYYS